jgi:CDP-diglyceride synthetase
MAEFIKQSWVFPVVQSIHIIGITMLVGTICLLDLRLLRSQSTEEFAARLAPWTTTGLLTVLITGPVLFGSDLTRYVQNPAFVVKMVLLAVALAAHFTLHRSVNPSRQKIAAILSLLLWSSVVLAGRAIADFDIHV